MNSKKELEKLLRLSNPIKNCKFCDITGDDHTRKISSNLSKVFYPSPSFSSWLLKTSYTVVVKRSWSSRKVPVNFILLRNMRKNSLCQMLIKVVALIAEETGV